jgi:hypothetical protein
LALSLACSTVATLPEPLLLPIGLELGGFIFLAAGLAPTRRENEIAAATEVQEVPKPEPAAAMEMQEIATPAVEIAKPAATGTPAPIYLARLQREFPKLATQVASGELSVFRASAQRGLRKDPTKRKWSASDYAKGEAAKV